MLFFHHSNYFMIQFLSDFGDQFFFFFGQLQWSLVYSSFVFSKSRHLQWLSPFFGFLIKKNGCQGHQQEPIMSSFKSHCRDPLETVSGWLEQWQWLIFCYIKLWVAIRIFGSGSYRVRIVLSLKHSTIQINQNLIR